MQFFEHQDEARGQTALLLTLFGVAVLGLVGLSAWSTHVLLILNHTPDEPLATHHWSWVASAAVSTFGVIFLGSAYRTAQLGRGGREVAENLSGTLVTAQAPDFLERRCVHIVEEMAIAAGLPVPPLYVLRTEMGINAFAAGWSPDDAVIGVTRGALESLNREQLQGVIAHEFSHILNRDCALNMRLIGVLHGIVLISMIGRILIRFGSGGSSSTSRRSAVGTFFLLGLGLWLLGSLGALSARLIQAAVSRQREYLADASAVQFTRNPDGIAGALATIASHSSALTSPRGPEMSHMLISEPGGSSLFSALDSHPSLFERIRRLLPNWSGEFSDLATRQGSVRKAAELQQNDEEENLAQEFFIHATGLDAGTASMEEHAALPLELVAGGSRVTGAGRILRAVPPRLRAAAEDPFSCRALIMAWVLDAREQERSAQLALLSTNEPLLTETEQIALRLSELDAALVLPLFDVALGSLATLSEPQRRAFHDLLSAVSAQLSGRAYRSFCLAALALRHLAPDAAPRKTRAPLLKDAIEVALGILAVEGSDDPKKAAAAFAKGQARLGKRGADLRLPDGAALHVRALDGALGALLRLPVTTRAAVLDAAEVIAQADGVLRPTEAQLLRTLATCLGVAVPPALPAHAI